MLDLRRVDGGGDEAEVDELATGLLLGAKVWPRALKISLGVSLCSIKLFLLFLPGVNIAVRR